MLGWRESRRDAWHDPSWEGMARVSEQNQQEQQTQGGQQEQGQQQTQQEGGQQTPASFEAWLAGQPEDVKRLASEREQRKQLATQLRDATGKLEKGSDAARTLEEISGKLGRI